MVACLGNEIRLIHEAWTESEKIVDEYRCKLRATERGLDGEKVALRRVQDLANKVRPQGMLVSSHDHHRRPSTRFTTAV